MRRLHRPSSQRKMYRYNVGANIFVKASVHSYFAVKSTSDTKTYSHKIRFTIIFPEKNNVAFYSYINMFFSFISNFFHQKITLLLLSSYSFSPYVNHSAFGKENMHTMLQHRLPVCALQTLELILVRIVNRVRTRACSAVVRLKQVRLCSLTIG